MEGATLFICLIASWGCSPLRSCLCSLFRKFSSVRHRQRALRPLLGDYRLSAPCLADGGFLLALGEFAAFGVGVDDVAAAVGVGSEFIDLVLEGNHAARDARHPLAIHGDEGFGRPNDGRVAKLLLTLRPSAKFVLDVLERHAGELDGGVAARHCREFGLLRFHEGLGGVLHEFGELVAVERHSSVLSVGKGSFPSCYSVMRRKFSFGIEQPNRSALGWF